MSWVPQQSPASLPGPAFTQSSPPGCPGHGPPVRQPQDASYWGTTLESSLTGRPNSSTSHPLLSSGPKGLDGTIRAGTARAQTQTPWQHILPSLPRRTPNSPNQLLKPHSRSVNQQEVSDCMTVGVCPTEDWRYGRNRKASRTQLSFKIWCKTWKAPYWEALEIFL